MEPELFSQAGMEISCQKFSARINSETDQRGPSFNVNMKSRYESCDFAGKTLLLSFPVEEYMRNPAGVMHGGAVAGALDITMGSLTYYMSGEFLTPTINLNVSYERPFPRENGSMWRPPAIPAERPWPIRLPVRGWRIAQKRLSPVRPAPIIPPAGCVESYMHRKARCKPLICSAQLFCYFTKPIHREYGSNVYSII